MPISSIDPATGATLAEYEEMGAEAVEARLAGADRAFLAWRDTGFAEREVPMRTAARLLRERRVALSRRMAGEMGKPVRDGVAEVEKCALACEYFAEHAQGFLARESIAEGPPACYVEFRPLGVVLAVMPWNFPFWQVFRFAAPALMAGNAAVLKHASNVSGCALDIEQLLRDAGFPEQLFGTLLVSSRRIDALIADPRIRAVTLTGSVEAGRAVARRAGELLKKTVLELGGSDAYVILADAEVEAAAAACARGRLVNSGQSCIAAKRFIVIERVRARFEEALVEAMRAARVGDPLREDTQIGPMARRELRDALHGQVRTSIERGARCLLGGSIPAGPGAFYPPTVLTQVARGMPAYEEEMFGPVAAVIATPDEERAIAVANDSIFGLGGGVFSGDYERAQRLAIRDLEAGSVCVNATVQSDPRLPFGGVKASGYGRELSRYGMREFVNIKAIVAAPRPAPAANTAHSE